MSNDGTTPEPGPQQPESSSWPTPGGDQPAAPAPSGYEATPSSGPAPSGYEAPTWPTPPGQGSTQPTAAYPTAPVPGAPAGDADATSPYAAPAAGQDGAGTSAPGGAYAQPGGSYPPAAGSSYPQPGGSYPPAGGASYPQPGAGYPAGGYAQAPYASGQYQPPASSRTDGVSIAALITGILGTGVVAIVLGVLGLRRTKRNGTQGRGLAIAGLVLGGLGVLAWVVGGIAVVAAINAHGNQLSEYRAACTAGDMAACNSLYQEAPIGSDDEEFGETCGGRTDGDVYCETIDADRWAYGDDADLDALWDACDSGDMAACDDLYSSAPAGSEYEEFGSTCAGTSDGTEYCDSALSEEGTQDPAEGTTTAGAQNYGDDPTLDALWDACEGGSGTACDELYFSSEAGTAYEQFANTCGNRVEYALSCASEIGG